MLYGVRLINMGLTHWFDTEGEQLAFAAHCGFQYALEYRNIERS
jgi:hypothetical protein